MKLAPSGRVRSFANNRKATCKGCFDTVINPGEKRITFWNYFKYTVYLCPACAVFEAEKLEELASNLRRAASHWIDTEQEWEANRIRNEEAS